MSNSFLGIDVAKLKLDVALLRDDKTRTRQFDNSTAGFQALQAWLTSLHLDNLQVCLEATGSYAEAIAVFLHQAGYRVSVVNPLRIKGEAQAQMKRNKTDRADARLIADFCQKHNPPPWQPPSPAVAELQAITRRLEVLEEMLQAEKNRLPVTPVKTQPSVQRMIANLEQEIEELNHSIDDHFDKHPELKEQSRLLQTIPGIGEKTAKFLLAEIDFSRYESARAVAAYAGVTPRKNQSGTSVKGTNLSKLGNGRIRKGIYFPAIVAKNHNELVKEFAKRLEERGKSQMQIVCASMRKLLHIAFGVLKNKTPYNPNLAFGG